MNLLEDRTTGEKLKQTNHLFLSDFWDSLLVLVRLPSGSELRQTCSSSAKLPSLLSRLLLFQPGIQMGFWTLMEGLLMMANAMAILNEDRFLGPRGWTLAELQGGRRNSFKGQIIGLIHACQFMRLPLIILNILVIVVKLVSG
ncbi:Protein transport protein yos1 [Linum grandiflorum]